MGSEKVYSSWWRNTMLFILIAVCSSAGFLLAQERYVQAAGLFGVTLLVLVRGISIYNHTNKLITSFFNALSNNDTSIQFPSVQHNKTLQALYQSMNNLNRHFQTIKMQNEYNEQYYKTLIRHSATGLLVINSAGQVELINKVACQYAGISPDSTNPNLLKIRNPQFFEAIYKVQPGEDITYKHVIGNRFQLLSFRATEIIKSDNKVKLVSIQDIRQELEARELESYKKLISVLTHEIMNLTSPLTAVSKSLYEQYHNGVEPVDLSAVDDALLKATLNGLQVIDEQTTAILNFVSNYRKISKIPQPVFQSVDIAEWVEQLRIVYTAKMADNGIHFTVNMNTGQKSILADKGLLTQVMINLIHNAMDAVMENEAEREIGVGLSQASPGRILLVVSNNGPLIPPDIQEKIFIPFFTTKEQGSGIGLSICQEIIRLHKGSLAVVSLPRITKFIVEL